MKGVVPVYSDMLPSFKRCNETVDISQFIMDVAPSSVDVALQNIGVNVR